MNADMFFAFAKDAIGRSVKTGATQMLEEAAEALSADDLAKLIVVLQKVEKRKRGTVTVTGSTSK